MATRKKGKAGSAHKRPASVAHNVTPSTTPRATNTDTRGSVADRTTVAAPAPPSTQAQRAGAKPAAGTSSTVVRRANVNSPQYRNRMGRLARRRRQRTVIMGSLAAVVVVGALAWLILSHRTTSPTSSHAANPTAQACTTNERTGLNGTPAAAGGPPAVSGKLVTLAQCLQYIDVKPGTGAAVKAGDTVTVNYTGWLTDGTKFDSSLNSGRTPFQVQNVGQAQLIQGWNIGLVGMKVGGERRLIIPPALGYGAQGSPPTIPANATLIFDITVVSIP